MTQDEEHLKLLSIFHYVVGGLAGLFSLFPVFHLVFGLFFIFAPEKFTNSQSPPPAFLGWFFVIFALVFIGIGLLTALGIIACGRFLDRRKYYLFCLVMAAIECVFIPFGTVLGVFTIIVLMREPVKQLFATKKASST
jgi:hypothetical protein